MNANILYYDIESVPNLFSLALYYEMGTDENPDARCDVFYQIGWDRDLNAQEMQEVLEEIRKNNPNLPPYAKIGIYSLKNREAVLWLAQMLGVTGSKDLTVDFPLIRDIDPDYDPEVHPYLAGYNNVNYDDPMLAIYFSEAFAKGCPEKSPDEKLMRKYNDEFFAPDFKKQMPSRLRYVYVRDPKEKQKGLAWIKKSRAAAKSGNLRNPEYVQVGNEILKNDGWNAQIPAKYVYEAMQNSGRHLDVARLNEKQFRVGLKRLLGMLGYQIREPEISLNAQAQMTGPISFEILKNTLAYNVSDVVQLSHLMEHPAYTGPFLLKRQMLKDYPGAVYRQKEITEEEPVKDGMGRIMKSADGKELTRPVTKLLYEPDVRPEMMRKDRLNINASSAKLAAAALCPYGQLADSSVVDFQYPHPDKAKERNVPVTNVLDTLKTFIKNRMEPLVKSEEGREIIDSLNQVVEMYGNICGKDFNASHDEEGYGTTEDIKKYKKRINVCYMGPDGEPTSSFVTFSIGGIHGAEYHKERYEADVAAFHEKQALFQKVLGIYPDALDMLTDINAKGKPCRRKAFEMDGVTYETKQFLTSGSTLKKAEYKKEFTNPKKPELFPLTPKGNRKLHPRYTYTSFGEANHEDFTSYYPRMLSQMKAFWNAAMGRDPYEEIFQNKGKFGKMMKDPQYDEATKALYSNMRNGTKLVLNAASGAADTEYKTSIRMNNNITKMRILGQLFAFMIGQAQALAGARVPSTNTDGIYTFFEEEENNRILFEEAAISGVEIEPERLYLVSKDTNNRIEFKITGNTGDLMKDIKILSFSGGTLGCMDGPDPNLSLDHPAIQDWGVGWTLIQKALVKNAMDAFDPEIAKYLLYDVAPTWTFLPKNKTFSSRRRLLMMYQHIVASSPGTHIYTFASKTPISDPESLDIDPLPCQHYMRVFYVDPEKLPDEKRDEIRYLASAYMMKRPDNRNLSWIDPDCEANKNLDASPAAIKVIRDYNGDLEALSGGGIPKIKKIKGISTCQPVLIVNDDLDYTDFDPAWLDLEYYVNQIKNCYTNSWSNVDVHKKTDDDDAGEAA